VVPARASALLDCRLLPGTTPEQIIAELRRLVGQDPAISFDTISYTAAYGSPWDDPFFDALARHVVGDRRDAVAGPVLSIGFTDSIYARRVGTRAYGLVPFEVTQEEAELMHAPGERVSTANVTRGLRVLFGAVLEVAAALDRSAPAGAPRRPPPFRPVPASALEGPAPSTAPSSAPASTAAR